MNQPILNQLIVDAPKTKTIWPQPHTSHFLQRAILSGGIPMNSLYKKVDNHQLPLSAWFPPCLQSCACSKAGFFAEPESTMAANPNSLEAQTSGNTKWQPETHAMGQGSPHRISEPRCISVAWLAWAGWSVHSTAIHIWVYRCVYI
jgi:hypothetical protein